LKLLRTFIHPDSWSKWTVWFFPNVTTSKIHKFWALALRSLERVPVPVPVAHIVSLTRNKHTKDHLLLANSDKKCLLVVTLEENHTVHIHHLYTWIKQVFLTWMCNDERKHELCFLFFFFRISSPQKVHKWSWTCIRTVNKDDNKSSAHFSEH
jgi:hypothetical protein